MFLNLMGAGTAVKILKRTQKNAPLRLAKSRCSWAAYLYYSRMIAVKQALYKNGPATAHLSTYGRGRGQRGPNAKGVIPNTF